MRHIAQHIGMNFKLTTYMLLALGLLTVIMELLYLFTYEFWMETMAIVLGMGCGFVLFLMGLSNVYLMKKAQNAPIEEFKKKEILLWDQKDYSVFEESSEE